ncbi:MAG: hypothetical protein AAF926_01570 [Pseudomonadota bacterium]
MTGIRFLWSPASQSGEKAAHRAWAILLGAVLLSACTAAQSPSEQFFTNMQALCGKTLTGSVVSDQAVDADWIGQVLTVGPVTCEPDVMRMPLAVGDDQSRTWVLGHSGDALIFRHEHVEPDGSPSAVTDYGGPARADGTAARQDFPADEATKANFTANGIAVSNPNVWTLSIDDEALRYALARPATDTAPARDFRAVFPLGQAKD